MKKILKNKKILILAGLALAIFAGYYFFSGQKNQEINYEIFKPEIRNLEKTISADGEVVADYEINLASEIPGIISKVYVKEGDFVKKGQLLMKLKDTDYRNQINSAYVNQKINEASFEKVKNPNQNLDTDKAIIEDSAEIISANIQKTKNNIQAQIDALDIYLSQLLRMEIDDYFDHTDTQGTIYQPTLTYRLKSEDEISRLEVERKTLEKKYSAYKNSSKNIDEAISITKDFEKMIFDLYKNSRDFLGFTDRELEIKEKHLSSLKNQISAKKTAFINLKTSLANLEKQLDSNKKSVKKVENIVNSADLKLAKERIRQARVQTHSAYTQLQKTYIRAPKDGIIVRVQKKQGEYAGPSVPLIKINSQKKYIEVDIPEVDIAKIKKEMEAEIKIDAFGDRIFKGKVDFIYPEKKEIFGIVYYKTRILFEGDDWKKENILPGMSVEVKIPFEKKENILALKRGVAQKDERGYFVNVFDKEKNIVKKYFKAGFVGDNFVGIVDGIDENTEAVKLKK